MGKQEPADDKRAKILAAATNLLADRGVQALSYENVAHEADLSRQLVRYYYSDLDSLIVDLCDHLANVYRELLVTGIVDVGKVRRLDFFLDFFFDMADEKKMPAKLQVYDAMVAYSVGSAELKERMCENYKTLGQVMTHELAIAYPQLDGTACEEISYLFVSLMHTNWSFIASLGFSREHSRVTRKAMDRLIASYVSEAPSVPLMERPWSRD